VERNGGVSGQWFHLICVTWVVTIMRVEGYLFGGSLSLQKKKTKNTDFLKTVFYFKYIVLPTEY
jgi:hypothetical protein